MDIGMSDNRSVAIATSIEELEKEVRIEKTHANTFS